MKETIGVVMAAFNGAQYIETQLKSIINQSVKPDLIVVSDGGSDDNTVDICNRVLSSSSINYSVLLSDIHLSVQNNFNKALSFCDCDYIFFADQDDYWQFNKIELTVDCMKRSNACLAFTNAEIVNNDLSSANIDLWNRIGFHTDNYLSTYTKGDTCFSKELLKHNVVTGMTMCISSKLKQIAIPLNNMALHDKWIALLAIHFGNVVAIDEKTVLYRQHDKNVVGVKISLWRKVLKIPSYLTRVNERKEMLLGICDIIASNEDVRDIKDCIRYINFRIDFIQKKSSFTRLLHEIKHYYQFENNPIEVICKDLLIRLYLIIRTELYIHE